MSVINLNMSAGLFSGRTADEQLARESVSEPSFTASLGAAP